MTTKRDDNTNKSSETAQIVRLEFNKKGEIGTLISNIRGSLKLRNEAIEQIYTDQELNRIVKGSLIKMGCAKNDSNDYFTEAIINFTKACYRPNFEIKSSLANYLTGIAKNIWLKEVTKVKKRNTIVKETILKQSTTDSPEVVLIEEEKKQHLYQLLSHLDERCKKVLTLWSHKKCMREIAGEMNYKSEGMARKKKHQCLRRLYQILDEHPSLIEQLR